MHIFESIYDVTKLCYIILYYNIYIYIWMYDSWVFIESFFNNKLNKYTKKRPIDTWRLSNNLIPPCMTLRFVIFCPCVHLHPTLFLGHLSNVFDMWLLAINDIYNWLQTIFDDISFLCILLLFYFRCQSYCRSSVKQHITYLTFTTPLLLLSATRALRSPWQ